MHQTSKLEHVSTEYLKRGLRIGRRRQQTHSSVAPPDCAVPAAERRRSPCPHTRARARACVCLCMCLCVFVRACVRAYAYYVCMHRRMHFSDLISPPTFSLLMDGPRVGDRQDHSRKDRQIWAQRSKYGRFGHGRQSPAASHGLYSPSRYLLSVCAAALRIAVSNASWSTCR